jgi:hypothetical protein
LHPRRQTFLEKYVTFQSRPVKSIVTLEIGSWVLDGEASGVQLSMSVSPCAAPIPQTLAATSIQQRWDFLTTCALYNRKGYIGVRTSQADADCRLAGAPSQG